MDLSPLAEFQKPETSPTSPYQTATSDLAWCTTEDELLTICAFVRSNGTVGIRLSAWIGFRDEDGKVVHHAWEEIPPNTPIHLSSVHDAKLYIGELSVHQGVLLNEWQDRE